MSSNDPLEIALRELESLEQLGIAALVAASSPEALETARIEYLGQKQGKLKAAQERLRTLDPAGKRVYGQRFNGVNQSLEAALNAARLRLERRAVAAGAIDVTLPGAVPRLGHRHPLTQTADELIDLFGRFGFSVARGPEVE
ncbi:MAG: phenylalanine--tRNA ligase subunit alpha, partial [Isosphaeraceae bacterium]